MFKFGKLVDPGDRAVIQAGVTIAFDYVQTLAGLQANPVVAYVYVDLSNVAVQWEGIAQASGTPPQLLIQGLTLYVGEAFPGTIFINSGAQAWKELSPVHQLRLAAHEYFHTAQMNLMGPENAKAFYSGPTNTVTVAGPNWLIEGSAEYISWRVLQELGLLSLDDYISTRDLSHGDPRSVATYDDFYGKGQQSYELSLNAVYRLVRGRDTLSLITYFQLMGQGAAWELAFQQSFGRPIKDFYAEYD